MEDRLSPAGVVTNLLDSGAGSLRAALVGGGLVTFQPGLTGTITLTSGELSINANTTIQGPGAGVITVSGNNAFRIFNINGPGALDVSIAGLTLTNGQVANSGGAIYIAADENLTLTDCVITGNTASVNGGGINAYGFSGTLTVRNSIISGNTAGEDGGGIHLDDGGTLTVQNSIISGNTAGEDGGGIHFDDYGSLDMQNSTVSGNTAGNNGGGIRFEDYGSLDMQNSTVSGNTAGNNGGGIYLFGSNLDVLIENSTISGNTATAGNGGGILAYFYYYGTLTIRNSTITGNTAGIRGGGIYFYQSVPHTLQLQSTIVAGNTASSAANGHDIFRGAGTINASNSLIQDVPTGTINGTDTANIFGVPALLGPLQNNGGPTQTHALLPGSPAIDTGANPAGLQFDQRGPGFARTIGGFTDIGAYEVQPPPPPPGETCLLAVGADAGAAPHVRVYNADGSLRLDFFAYDVGFLGGVRVATGDVNGDGFEDIITGAGSGGGSHVKVFDGLDGTQLLSFFAFPGFNGGVFVAAGDLNGDQFAEIVVGTDAGPAAEVRAFDHNGVQLLSFLPYAGYQGGVTVAVGDVNGDGFGDIVTGAAGVGGNGHVKVFAFGAQVQSFFAFGGSWSGGIFVAAGDVNGDGFADLIIGKGLGGNGQVTVYSGVNNAVVLANFFAYPPLPVVSLVPVFGDPVTASSSVEVRVGACDTNGDGHADILTGPGPGLSPLVKVFDGLTLAELDSFFAFDPAFQGGIFVGG